ncbi:MAG: hypothetical protein M1831_001957 [Alyxoria varia]|nr:MAG: hypothetical protein M1831_001957 [Alyxoria varia]
MASMQESIPFTWDPDHPLSWDTDDEICSWNHDAEGRKLPEGSNHQPTTYALRDGPNDPAGEQRKMIEKSIPLQWDPADEICSWNKNRAPEERPSTYALRDDPNAEQRVMIEKSIPLSWNPADEVCTWNRNRPNAEGRPDTKGLRDPGDSGEQRTMIKKSIPLSWDAGDEICSWNRDQKLVEENALPIHTLDDPEGKQGEKTKIMNRSVPLSWNTQKPLSWFEGQPAYQRKVKQIQDRMSDEHEQKHQGGR